MSDFTIVSDSNIYTEPESYTRTLSVATRNTETPRMAHLSVKVHRYPESSFAKVMVWDGIKFTDVAFIDPDEWWAEMPGYQRGRTRLAARKVHDLVEDLRDELQSLLDKGLI